MRNDTLAATLPWVVALTAIVLFTILGNPFRYDSGNSARYLVPVYRNVNPALFPHDEVVDGLSRFESVYYHGLSGMVKATGGNVENVLPFLRAFYVGAVVLFFTALLLLLRRIGATWLTFALFAGWISHDRASPIGGESFFMSIPNHFLFVLGLLTVALLLILQRRHLAFWVVASVALFVHSLHSLFFVLAVVPAVLVIDKKGSRQLVIGGIVFAAAFAVYALVMTPPRMSPVEAQIFWQAKGDMAHVSVLSQSPLGWLRFGLLMAAVGMALRLTSWTDRASRILCSAALFAAVIGSAISVVVVVTHNPSLALLQPMRSFTWFTFFVHIVILLAAAKAWDRGLTSGLLLVGYVIAAMQYSLFSDVLLAVGAVALVKDLAVVGRVQTGHPARKEMWGVVFLGLLVVANVAAMIGKAHHNFESLLDPFPAVSLLGVALAWLPIVPVRASRVLVAAAIFVGLLDASHGAFNRREGKRDGDWIAACAWIQHNTRPADRFLLALAKQKGDFRTRSLRPCDGEPMSALAWVAPLTYQHTLAQNAEVTGARGDAGWRVQDIAALAARWGDTYVMIDDTTGLGFKPVAAFGPYSILQCDALLGMTGQDTASPVR